MQKKELTVAYVRAMFAETERFLKKRFAETEKAVKEASRAAKEASEAVKDFARKSEGISEVVKEASRAAKEASEAVKEFARKSEGISEVVKEASRASAEASEAVKDFARKSAEASEVVKEASRAAAEASRASAEASATVKEVSRQLGGISDNQGYHAEQFFQDVFKKKLEFGGIKYDEMIPNLAYRGKRTQIEFDIALVNGSSVALIEAKNRIYPNFVNALAEERIEKFRKFFREFDGYDVYLGIAGFSFCDEVLDRASSYGVGVIKQVGEGVEVRADNLRVY